MLYPCVILFVLCFAQVKSCFITLPAFVYYIRKNVYSMYVLLKSYYKFYISQFLTNDFDSPKGHIDEPKTFSFSMK